MRQRKEQISPSFYVLFIKNRQKNYCTRSPPSLLMSSRHLQNVGRKVLLMFLWFIVFNRRLRRFSSFEIYSPCCSASSSASSDDSPGSDCSSSDDSSCSNCSS